MHYCCSGLNICVMHAQVGDVATQQKVVVVVVDDFDRLLFSSTRTQSLYLLDSSSSPTTNFPAINFVWVNALMWGKHFPNNRRLHQTFSRVGAKMKITWTELWIEPTHRLHCIQNDSILEILSFSFFFAVAVTIVFYYKFFLVRSRTTERAHQAEMIAQREQQPQIRSNDIVSFIMENNKQ